jgi:hypothetical protein
VTWPLSDAALSYAGRGWPVFPCRPKAKMPLTSHGLNDATTQPATIERWWRRWPDANVAIRTGAISRLVVLDIDGEGGAESLRALERDHGPLPCTASVVTPGGGQHFYFKHPGTAVPSSAEKLAAGVDTRGEGGYVVAPPSIGETGRRYEPDERSPLAPTPGWLLELLGEHGTNRARTPSSEWLAIMRDGVPDGQRNDRLTRLVGHLLRRYVDVDLVAELAYLVNAQRCKPPLPAQEVDRIIDSIATRELRRREGTRL